MSETTDSAVPEREWIIRDWDERLTELDERASTARRYALKELDGVIRTLRRQLAEAKAGRAEAEAERDAAFQQLAEAIQALRRDDEDAEEDVASEGGGAG